MIRAWNMLIGLAQVACLLLAYPAMGWAFGLHWCSGRLQRCRVRR